MSRRRYSKRVRILPSGRAAALTGKEYDGELFPKVCREIETIKPKDMIDVEKVCDQGLFCPLCGKRIALEEYSRLEYRSKCGTCKKFVIAMFFNPTTCSFTLKKHPPK
jgi:ribosomal protein S27AE